MSGINHFANLGMMSEYAGSKNVPAPGLAVMVSGAMLVLGGLSVVLGLFPVVGLWLLILLLVPTSLIMVGSTGERNGLGQCSSRGAVA